MRILVARTAGFCLGVRRAMEMAVKALASAPPPVRSAGPLIHNRQAVALLANRGLKCEAAGEGGTVSFVPMAFPLPSVSASLPAAL
ncbi:MAG: hypothetical protein N3A66_07450 [Planctomycetota bacterium]|nr:hypothetical protein [Planctomycetota bacterium]